MYTNIIQCSVVSRSSPNRPHSRVLFHPAATAQWLQEVISQLALLNEAQQLTAATSLGFEMCRGCIPSPQPLRILKGQKSRSKLWTEKASPVARRKKLSRPPKGFKSETQGWLLFITEMVKPKREALRSQQHIPQAFVEPRERRKMNWISILCVWSFLAITIVLGRKALSAVIDEETVSLRLGDMPRSDH